MDEAQAIVTQVGEIVKNLGIAFEGTLNSQTLEVIATQAVKPVMNYFTTRIFLAHIFFSRWMCRNSTLARN